MLLKCAILTTHITSHLTPTGPFASDRHSIDMGFQYNCRDDCLTPAESEVVPWERMRGASQILIRGEITPFYLLACAHLTKVLYFFQNEKQLTSKMCLFWLNNTHSFKWLYCIPLSTFDIRFEVNLTYTIWFINFY